MSERDQSDDIEEDLSASGDVLQQSETQKKSPVKMQAPPPAQPRPYTARGLRTSFRQQSTTSAPLNETTNQPMEELECRMQFPSEQPQSSSKFSDTPSTSGRSNVTHFKQPQQKKDTKTFVDQVSEEERRVGDQGRLFMNMFIEQRAAAENILQEPVIREVCHADGNETEKSDLSDETLNDIAVTLRKIGDEISQNVELNNFIDQVPFESTKDIFVKVCLQIFKDGDMNWGRVVALFYFAYRLIMRTLSKGMDSLPWVKDMLQWAGDFLVKHVARWVISRGGWKMIKEWFGPSNRTWMMLFFASLTFGLWAYFRKD